MNIQYSAYQNLLVLTGWLSSIWISNYFSLGNYKPRLLFAFLCALRTFVIIIKQPFKRCFSERC